MDGPLSEAFDLLLELLGGAVQRLVLPLHRPHAAADGRAARRAPRHHAPRLLQLAGLHLGAVVRVSYQSIMEVVSCSFK